LVEKRGQVREKAVCCRGGIKKIGIKIKILSSFHFQRRRKEGSRKGGSSGKVRESVILSSGTGELAGISDWKSLGGTRRVL